MTGPVELAGLKFTLCVKLEPHAAVDTSTQVLLLPQYSPYAQDPGWLEGEHSVPAGVPGTQMPSVVSQTSPLAQLLSAVHWVKQTLRVELQTCPEPQEPSEHKQ